MASDPFALQYLTATCIDGAQRLLSFFFGPFCVTGRAVLLGLVVVDLKLFVGLLMWGGVWTYWFHGQPHLEPTERVDNFYLKMVVTFGKNLCMLSFTHYHGEVWLGTVTMVSSLLLMIFSNSYLVTALFHEQGKQWQLPVDRNCFRIDSIYEDMSKPLVQLWWIFALQSCLCVMAVYTNLLQDRDLRSKHTITGSAGLLLQGEPLTSIEDVGCYMYWLLGFLVQMGAYFQRGNDSQLGRTWKIEQWLGLARMHDDVEFRYGKDNEGRWKWKWVTESEIRTRAMLGFLVNTLYRDVIAFTTPLVLLKSESPMHAVAGAFALSYIPTLDDVKNQQLHFFRRVRERTEELLQNIGAADKARPESWEHDAAKLFDLWDKDRSGALEAAEYERLSDRLKEHVFEKIGYGADMPAARQVVADLFLNLDTNGDGTVSKEEFLKTIKSAASVGYI